MLRPALSPPTFAAFAAAFFLLASGFFPAQAQASDQDFLKQVTANFAAWDLDHDGQLSADEIELAVHNPKVQGQAAAAAAALRRAVRATKDLAPLKLATIKQSIPYNSKADPKPPRYGSLYDAAMKRIENSPKVLFVDGDPNLESLAQGRLGDCFLLAGLGACVAHTPQRLQEIIQPQPDGKLKVVFGSGQTVTIDPPTDGEIAIASTTRGKGTWSIAFEKAVGHFKLDNQKTNRHCTPLSIIGVGGSPSTVVKLITGHQVKRLSCKEFQTGKLDDATREAKLQEIRDALTANLKAKRLIVGGTASKGSQAIVPGLYYNHSYAVLDYLPERDVVVFWNPMSNGRTPKGSEGLANGYRTSYGRFECPLNEAVMWFGSFSVETDEPMTDAQ